MEAIAQLTALWVSVGTTGFVFIIGAIILLWWFIKGRPAANELKERQITVQAESTVALNGVAEVVKDMQIERQKHGAEIHEIKKVVCVVDKKVDKLDDKLDEVKVHHKLCEQRHIQYHK